MNYLTIAATGILVFEGLNFIRDRNLEANKKKLPKSAITHMRQIKSKDATWERENLEKDKQWVEVQKSGGYYFYLMPDGTVYMTTKDHRG